LGISHGAELVFQDFWTHSLNHSQALIQDFQIEGVIVGLG